MVRHPYENEPKRDPNLENYPNELGPMHLSELHLGAGACSTLQLNLRAYILQDIG